MMLIIFFSLFQAFFAAFNYVGFTDGNADCQEEWGVLSMIRVKVCANFFDKWAAFSCSESGGVLADVYSDDKCETLEYQEEKDSGDCWVVPSRGVNVSTILTCYEHPLPSYPLMKSYKFDSTCRSNSSNGVLGVQQINPSYCHYDNVRNASVKLECRGGSLYVQNFTDFLCQDALPEDEFDSFCIDNQHGDSYYLGFSCYDNTIEYNYKYFQVKYFPHSDQYCEGDDYVIAYYPLESCKKGTNMLFDAIDSEVISIYSYETDSCSGDPVPGTSVAYPNGFCVMDNNQDKNYIQFMAVESLPVSEYDNIAVSFNTSFCGDSGVWGEPHFSTDHVGLLIALGKRTCQQMNPTNSAEIYCDVTNQEMVIDVYNGTSTTSCEEASNFLFSHNNPRDFCLDDTGKISPRYVCLEPTGTEINFVKFSKKDDDDDDGAVGCLGENNPEVEYYPVSQCIQRGGNHVVLTCDELSITEEFYGDDQTCSATALQKRRRYLRKFHCDRDSNVAFECSGEMPDIEEATRNDGLVAVLEFYDSQFCDEVVPLPSNSIQKWKFIDNTSCVASTTDESFNLKCNSDGTFEKLTYSSADCSGAPVATESDAEGKLCVQTSHDDSLFSLYFCYYECSEIPFYDPSACNGGYGVCVAENNCQCVERHDPQSDCLDVDTCNGVNFNNSEVCNGNGNCSASLCSEYQCNCTCFAGWSGRWCDVEEDSSSNWYDVFVDHWLYWTIGAAALVVIVLIILIIIFIVCIISCAMKKKKKKVSGDVDLDEKAGGSGSDDDSDGEIDVMIQKQDEKEDDSKSDSDDDFSD